MAHSSLAAFCDQPVHAWQDVAGASIVAICDRDRAAADRRRPVRHQQTLQRCSRDVRRRRLRFRRHRDHRPRAIAPWSRWPPRLQGAGDLPSHSQTLDDAKAMVKVCADAGLPLMVHENFRWQTPIQAVKKVLEAGTISQPFWGRFSFRSGYDVFSGQPYLAEGGRSSSRTSASMRSTSPATFWVTWRSAGARTGGSIRNHRRRCSQPSCSTTKQRDFHRRCQLYLEAIDRTLPRDADRTRQHRRRHPPVAGLQARSNREERNRGLGRVADAALWASRPWHNIQESVAIQQHWAERLAAGAPGLDLRRRQPQDLRTRRSCL